MTIRNRLLSRTLASFAFLGALWVTAELSRVPAQQGGKGQERLNYDEKAYTARLQDIRAMFKGEAPADKNTMDLAAQHYAYRLTLTDLQNKKDKMPYLVREVISELDSNRRDDRRASDAARLFNEALVTRLKEVLPNPRPIASINAAIILDHMAKHGNEEAADALAGALADKDMNDGTKFWAARGLHDFFVLAFPAGEEQPITFKDKAREARCVSALLSTFDLKSPQNPPANSEEIEGLRRLRHEVIRALGVSRFPSVVDGKGVSQSKTALALCRVLRSDGLNPPPRLDEQIEAAIGIAMLKMAPSKEYKPANEYQPDVSACHLARFVVDYSRRHQNRKEDNKAQPSQAHPWKTSAARLEIALGALKNEVAAMNRNDPNKYKNAVAYINEVFRLTLPILKSIEADSSGAAAEPLADFLEKSPRDDQPVYKGDPNSVVKPGGAALATEPAKEKPATEEKKK